MTEYRIVSAGNHLVTINKSCRVNALLPKEQGAMRVVQRGSWVFNRILAIPESMDLSHEVVPCTGINDDHSCFDQDGPGFGR